MNRLTIVERVYHQSEQLPATLHESSAALILDTPEQAFVRLVTLTPDRKTLKALGSWVEAPSLLVIENFEGKPGQTKRGEAEKTLIAQRKVLFGGGIGEAIGEISPGLTARFKPTEALYLWSPPGTEVKAWIKVYPT